MDRPQKTGWLGRNWGCLVPVGLICAVVILIASIILPPIDPALMRKRETVNRQTRLILAIEAYRKATGALPDADYNPYSSNPDQHDPAKEVALLLAKLRGEGPDDPVYRATRPFLGDDGGASLTVDAYGNAMIFLKDKGVGGNPVMISAGPDGVFGYERNHTREQRQQYKKDNIFSDTSN